MGLGRSVAGCQEGGIRPWSKARAPFCGARGVPARQLHIEHVVAFTTLHRGQGVTERCLQHSAARGALELEGRLIGHRAGFRGSAECAHTGKRLSRIEKFNFNRGKPHNASAGDADARLIAFLGWLGAPPAAAGWNASR